MFSRSSTRPKPVLDLVIEYENLLRSLLPKLDEYDRIRVLEKVTLKAISLIELGDRDAENQMPVGTRDSVNSIPSTPTSNVSSGNVSEGFLGAGSDISFLRCFSTVAVINGQKNSGTAKNKSPWLARTTFHLQFG